MSEREGSIIASNENEDLTQIEAGHKELDYIEELLRISTLDEISRAEISNRLEGLSMQDAIDLIFYLRVNQLQPDSGIMVKQKELNKFLKKICK